MARLVVGSAQSHGTAKLEDSRLLLSSTQHFLIFPLLLTILSLDFFLLNNLLNY